jgi:hypothetical protein
MLTELIGARSQNRSVTECYVEIGVKLRQYSVLTTGWTSGRSGFDNDFMFPLIESPFFYGRQLVIGMVRFAYAS